MASKAVTLEFEINVHGCPSVTASAGSFATVHFAPACRDQARDQIILSANRTGLLALARWMVALADDASYADHQHFDNEISSGFFTSDKDCEFIIERVGK